MSDEKRYLEELSHKLDEYASRVQSLPNTGNYEKLRQLLKEILTIEKELREACEIGKRFNVIKTQLQMLLEKFEKEVEAIRGTGKTADKIGRQLGSNERLVYVYLFNAQGSILKTWQKSLLPQALIEHSVNRPIYMNKEDVIKVIHAKPNKAQHAYLEIAVKENDIVSSSDLLKDQQGFGLLKLKQRALNIENIFSFFHDDKTYKIIEGEMILEE